jgi:hypothetical protein
MIGKIVFYQPGASIFSRRNVQTWVDVRHCNRVKSGKTVRRLRQFATVLKRHSGESVLPLFGGHSDSKIIGIVFQARQRTVGENFFV